MFEKEFLEFMSKLFTPEGWKTLTILAGGIIVIIDANKKIKWNPIKWGLRKIGRMINAEMLEKIDENNMSVSEKFEKINTRMDETDKRLEENERKTEKYRMASLHDRIVQMHRYFTQKNFVTESDLDNFKVCVDEYKDNGGNGLIHKKLEPEVYALQLVGDNDVVQKEENE